MPVSTFNGPGSSMTGVANPLAAGGESDMSRSGRMMAMPGAPQEVAVEEQSTDAKGNVKNPYKLNLAFDIVLPFGMCLVLVGGFAMSMSAKVVKHKHDIYGLSKEEQQTQVRDQYLASQKVMDDVKKMDPIVKLEAGDTAGALALATPMGKAAFELCAQQGMDAPQKGSSSQAPSKEELATEEKTVRELLAAGTVLARAGNKKDKDIGLTYMQKAEDIATYSKYVRLLFARELARTHHDEEAITQYEAINKLFLDPWILPHKELAPLYMRANRGADAVAELQLLMKTDPTDPGYQRQLGLAMAQNGDQQAGFEEFQKGFTHEQDVLSYPSAVKSLVDAHGGLVDATLADVKKQAEKSPQDIKLQLDLARLEIATQKLKEARDVMETARKTQELNPEVHEVMAEVMCRQNQQSSGYDEFRSAAQNLHLQQ
jgi:Flp pilus assembly protein TadD